MRTRVVLGMLLSVASVGCQRTPQPAALSQAVETFPKYNGVYGIGSHNSYWINRSDQTDFGSSGTQELLSDQLLHEHVNSLELDVHSEGAPAHQWKVYHTSDSEDFSCKYLTDCLELLMNFHYAVPQHEVINVVIELKNSTPWTGTYNASFTPVYHQFSDDHTLDDFDNIFRSVLGETLYTPSNYYADVGCTSDMTISHCASTKGWPTIDRLRGRFIVNVIGSYSTGAADWVQYANADVVNRVGFPMQSVFRLRKPSDVPTCGQTYRRNINLGFEAAGTDFVAHMENAVVLPDGTDLGADFCIGDILVDYNDSPTIDDGQRNTAFRQSAFWDMEDTYEDLSLEVTSQFVGWNGIVRPSDTYEHGVDCTTDMVNDRCQNFAIHPRKADQTALNSFQLLKTDYPWDQVNDRFDEVSTPGGIPVDPSQRLKDPASVPVDFVNGSVPGGFVIHEPGSRIYFNTVGPYPGAWAFDNSIDPTSEHWLEATVSTTRNGATWGENSPGGILDYLRSCPGFSGPHSDLPCTDFPRTAQEGGEGCIKVMSDAETDGLEICRQKNTTPGASYYQEGVDLYVRTFVGGQLVRTLQLDAPRYGPCRHSDDPNSVDVGDVCIGSMIAVAVKNEGSSSRVGVYSAGKLDDTTRTPAWHELGHATFSSPLTKQGYRGWKSQLFAGIRLADQLDEVGPDDWRPDPTRLHQGSLSDFPQSTKSDPSDQIQDLTFHSPLSRSSTSASILPVPNGNGWIGLGALAGKDAATLTLTSPSPLVLGGAVFRSIEYSLAGALLTGTISSSANPTMISVGAEGTTTATYLATDLDENRQNAQSTTIRIDKHPPTIQASVNPLPNLAGWNNRLPVTVSFTCADNVSGVQICPSAQSATSEGRGQVLSGIASDYASNTATASATLNIDVTPPVVSFSGNLGTYTVDQTVQIACAATDNLSGVVTYGSTCPATTSNVCLPIIGPAYSFLVGTTTSNQFSFAATDLADNCASAQGSFKVTVTYNSLCNLVQRFSSQQNISDELCAKLFSARSAPNQNAKAGKMGAFQNQVNAQSGKAIPADDAGILERLGAICLDEC